MKQIEIMDCTLRDGGWVNNFKFGRETMQKILQSLTGAGIRQIELGYLDQKAGSPMERSMYSGFGAIRANGLFRQMPADEVRTVMIDYGRFPEEEIPDREETGIDCIRLCFHRAQLSDAIRMGRTILDHGFILYLQPMVTTRYTDDELKEALEQIQAGLPEVSAVYVVDSLGVLGEKEITDRVRLVDRVLDTRIRLGVHTHNNRNLSFANAKAVCDLVRDGELNKDRLINIDCTLGGFGKGAGNLGTECFAEYLNGCFQTEYDLNAIRSLSDAVIGPLRKQFVWGFAPEYELTARYRTTPTYARVLTQEYGKSLAELETFLAKMPEEKKDAFDRSYVETVFGKAASDESV